MGELYGHILDMVHIIQAINKVKGLLVQRDVYAILKRPPVARMNQSCFD